MYSPGFSCQSPPTCLETLIGRQERASTSSPLSSHAQSLVANRRKQRYGMIAGEKLAVRFGVVRLQKPYQIVESQVSKVSWLNAKVLEGLRIWIDDLIQELTLDLVTGKDWPPESLVKEGGSWLKDGLWHVDVSAVLVDFLVNQLSDLSCGVVLWAVKLVCLGGSAVILNHLLQSSSDINGVNWPVTLLHVVGSKEVGDTSQLVEETILETEHWCWSDDGSLWVDGANDLLSSRLGSVELRWGVWVRVVAGDVDETVDIVLGDSISDSLCSLDIDILKIKVLRWVVTANQVVDNIGVADGLLQGLGVAEVVFHEDDTSKVTGDLQVSLGHLLTVWDNDSASLSRKSVDNISSKETSCAENSRGMSCGVR